MKFSRLISALIYILILTSCVTLENGPELQRVKKGKKNGLVSLVMPVAPARAHKAYTHSLIKSHRGASDCWPDCPKVDVWKYAYRAKQTDTLVSDKPIASKKEHWKTKNEARIIAIGYFDNNRLYLDGLLDYIKSFAHIKKVNNINDPLWGYETFTVRVYVSKRNPKNLALGVIENETSDDIIELFLSLGCEVAFVDNGLSRIGKDGTFWRFMVAGEQMPKGQRIRYLIRDADQILTAGEAFTVGEWINSGLQFHRMHLIPICFGPLTALSWAGSHEGSGPFPDMKTLIEYYPYRFAYGDDELFSRDHLWPRIKAHGSVMTHYYPRGIAYTFANPYEGSCEEPTQDYCDRMRAGGYCPDVEVPKDILTPLGAVGLRSSLLELSEHPEYFDLKGDTERGKKAIEALSLR